MDTKTLATELARLRKLQGVSLRQVARKAGLSSASLFAIEKGRSSPTMATMHKLLRALGTNFTDFFAASAAESTEPVFRAADVHTVDDKRRVSVFHFPKRKDLKFEILEGWVRSTESSVAWETHDFDLGGLIISGGPSRLEIKGVGQWVLKKGDAFYIKAGQKHRGVNLGKRPLHRVTVACPPRY
jgi:transcriptional regulator with XRE-family HTH domain